MNQISINAHSSVRVAGEQVFYVDPFKMTEAPHDADVVFVTHDHYDHFSPEDLEKVKKADTVLVVPESMKKAAVEKSGIAEEKIVTVKPGGETVVEGLPVKAVAAYNPNKHFHKKECGWVGYVVTSEGERIYVTGDTDDTEELRATPCDVLMLPVGGTFTMTVAEAAEAAAASPAKTVIPTHYGCIVGNASDGEAFRTAMQKTAPEKKVEVIL